MCHNVWNTIQRSATLALLGAVFIAASGCGAISPTAAPSALTGRLVTMQGAPGDKQFVVFRGRWVNEAHHAMTFLSTTPALLTGLGRTLYPWQYRAMMQSEFARHCRRENGKHVCVQPTPTTVTIIPGGTFLWNVTFAVPRRFCHTMATIHIRGLPGAVRTKVPCS